DHNLAELEVTLVKQEKILGQIRRLNETLGLIRVAGSTNLARMKQRGEFEAVFARLKEAVGVTSEKLEEYLRGIERAEAVVKDCRSVGRRCRTVALELADGLIKRAQEG
ncbi:MAG: hypothetical protein NZL93_05585, partial [Chthoniobacterales bacterium]|nr:hypothetical protein [Chthoniobacterales bacterium]